MPVPAKLFGSVEMKFEFATDKKSQEFCDEICRLLVKNFSLSEDESFQRVALWNGMPFEGEYDIRYHDSPEYWADHFFRYYDYIRTGDVRFHPIYGKKNDPEGISKYHRPDLH